MESTSDLMYSLMHAKAEDKERERLATPQGRVEKRRRGTRGEERTKVRKREGGAVREGKWEQRGHRLEEERARWADWPGPGSNEGGGGTQQRRPAGTGPSARSSPRRRSGAAGGGARRTRRG